jgi:hypothetical protein
MPAQCRTTASIGEQAQTAAKHDADDYEPQLRQCQEFARRGGFESFGVVRSLGVDDRFQMEGPPRAPHLGEQLVHVRRRRPASLDAVRRVDASL